MDSLTLKQTLATVEKVSDTWNYNKTTSEPMPMLEI